MNECRPARRKKGVWTTKARESGAKDAKNARQAFVPFVFFREVLRLMQGQSGHWGHETLNKNKLPGVLQCFTRSGHDLKRCLMQTQLQWNRPTQVKRAMWH